MPPGSMAPARRSVLREGIVAGLIGATVVAVWFLLFDFARGVPFFTPTLLGSALFYGVCTPVGLQVAVGPVIGYTIIHGLAFVAFGVIAASVMSVSEREPAVFVAFVILFACFEVFVLGVVGALGKSMLGALVWWAILVGNLLASVAMLWYLAREHPGLPRTLVGSAGTVLREGVIAGLIGAVVVAVWFLILDWIQGDPLRTPELLGSAILRQPPRLPAVLHYSVVHGLAFILFGVVGAVLIAAAERQPVFVFPLVILFTAFEVGFFGAVIISPSPCSTRWRAGRSSRATCWPPPRCSPTISRVTGASLTGCPRRSRTRTDPLRTGRSPAARPEPAAARGVAPPAR